MRKSEKRPDFSDVRGRRLLIALSGGADSVALAVMLAEARAEYGLTLFAAHIDHGIRPDSGADAAFCQTLCDGLGIPFLVARLDVPAEARARREGLETVARALRYERLCRFKAEVGADFIALAHHMDDQAETVLMHLARGAGPEGIGGMRAFAGDLYRPLLGLRKSQLVDYLRERGQDWREDFTNTVGDTPRNALRLRGIPELEKCWPEFVPAAARYAASAQIESDYMASLTGDYLAKHGGQNAFCAWLDLETSPHRAVLRRALRALCPWELDWERINALEALCGENRGKIDLCAGGYAERAGRRLYFVPKQLPSIEPVPLSLNGETRLDPIGNLIASPCAPIPVRGEPLRQVLNPAALEGAVLRTRRDGDRIRPLGGGDKLLSDYFIDRKVDRPLRDAIPLVAVGNRVHWVVGHGISQEAALGAGCDGIELRFNEQRSNLK